MEALGLVLEASWKLLEASWKPLGLVLEASWRPLGLVLEASWKLLEASWRPLGWVLEASWRLLEASWSLQVVHLGGFLDWSWTGSGSDLLIVWVDPYKPPTHLGGLLETFLRSS